MKMKGMNGHILSGTQICVDYWLWTPEEKYYHFLSHLHADHTAYLTSTFREKIYTSPFNAWLLRRWFNISPEYIVPLTVGEPYILYDAVSKTCFSVTLLDANHCPGSVMFLFQGDFGNILYTGDFRYNPKILEDHMLKSLIENEAVDKLYLDNTFAASHCEFPPRHEALKDVLNVIRDHPDHNIILGVRKIGKEEVLRAVALEFKEKVCVSEDRLRILTKLGYESVFTTDPKDSRIFVKEMPFITLSFINQLQEERGPVVTIFLTAFYSVIPLEDKVPLISKNVYKNIHKIPYSDHSCHSELMEFVSKIKPKQIIPIVSYQNNTIITSQKNELSEMFTCISQNSVLPESMLQLCGTSSNWVDTKPVSRMEFENYSKENVNMTEDDSETSDQHVKTILERSDALVSLEKGKIQLNEKESRSKLKFPDTKSKAICSVECQLQIENHDPYKKPIGSVDQVSNFASGPEEYFTMSDEDLSQLNVNSKKQNIDGSNPTPASEVALIENHVGFEPRTPVFRREAKFFKKHLAPMPMMTFTNADADDDDDDGDDDGDDADDADDDESKNSEMSSKVSPEDSLLDHLMQLEGANSLKTTSLTLSKNLKHGGTSLKNTETSGELLDINKSTQILQDKTDDFSQHSPINKECRDKGEDEDKGNVSRESELQNENQTNQEKHDTFSLCASKLENCQSNMVPATQLKKINSMDVDKENQVNHRDKADNDVKRNLRTSFNGALSAPSFDDITCKKVMIHEQRAFRCVDKNNLCPKVLSVESNNEYKTYTNSQLTSTLSKNPLHKENSDKDAVLISENNKSYKDKQAHMKGQSNSFNHLKVKNVLPNIASGSIYYKTVENKTKNATCNKLVSTKTCFLEKNIPSSNTKMSGKSESQNKALFMNGDFQPKSPTKPKVVCTVDDDDWGQNAGKSVSKITVKTATTHRTENQCDEFFKQKQEILRRIFHPETFTTTQVEYRVNEFDDCLSNVPTHKTANHRDESFKRQQEIRASILRRIFHPESFTTKQDEPKITQVDDRVKKVSTSSLDISKSKHEGCQPAISDSVSDFGLNHTTLEKFVLDKQINKISKFPKPKHSISNPKRISEKYAHLLVKRFHHKSSESGFFPSTPVTNGLQEQVHNSQEIPIKKRQNRSYSSLSRQSKDYRSEAAFYEKMDKIYKSWKESMQRQRKKTLKENVEE